MARSHEPELGWPGLPAPANGGLFVPDVVALQGQWKTAGPTRSRSPRTRIGALPRAPNVPAPQMPDSTTPSLSLPSPPVTAPPPEVPTATLPPPEVPTATPPRQEALTATVPPPEIPTASAVNAGGVAAMDNADLDQLANKLYDRVRSRLRADLRRDRERAGFLTDIPH
jgi:hypothetical protein